MAHVWVHRTRRWTVAAQRPAVFWCGVVRIQFQLSAFVQSTSTNPPTGRLPIELAYTDHGTTPLGAGFSIHGTADTLDPVLESEICIGQNPPPGGNELIFLGRYRTTSSGPGRIPQACTNATAQCRFEVIVRDNDQNGAPSVGDYFSIKLSTGTAVSSELDATTVFYTRAGLLSGGNLTVD